MEHSPSWSTILLNIAVQAINLLVFFLIFYFAFAKQIVDSLSERKILIARLQNADDEYKNIVANAESAAKKIIWEANTLKKLIIDEANILAKQKAEILIQEAESRAWSIIQGWEIHIHALEDDLKAHYEAMVKTTAASYLKKIFDQEEDIQTAYLEKVMKGIV